MMKKEAIKPQWQIIDKKPTWSHISTQELSEVLGVSVQNLNNWVLRGTMPQPEGKKRGYGNKNYFRISKIRSWLENKPENQIHKEWIENQFGDLGKLPTLKQAQDLVKNCWRILEVEKPI